MPALFNPGGPFEPRDHIVFYQEVPKGLTDLGKRTIDVLGLDEDRPDRKSYLEFVRLQKALAEHGESGNPTMQRYAKEALDFLAQAVKPDMPFSAMTIDFLRQMA